MVIGGDFNAHCRKSDDYIEGADDVTPWEIIDFSEKMPMVIILLICLVASYFAMLNGRICTRDFTRIFHKGKAVVDYIITPYEQLNSYTEVMLIFEITTVNNIPVLDNLI